MIISTNGKRSLIIIKRLESRLDGNSNLHSNVNNLFIITIFRLSFKLKLLQVQSVMIDRTWKIVLTTHIY